ncbi:hypothetical protein [Streptomyces sp. NPDC046805]|uniref:hypothetical protein n=1 Tax=Streptomyces sp. NPDC046805 TaxID=3155134 RepID=UPI0033E54F1B
MSANVDGTAVQHHYDAYGRAESTTGVGEVIERNTYDGFDHVVKDQRILPDGGQAVTDYSFDALDRTTPKTTSKGTTTFNCLGTSSETLSEAVAGEVTKSYQSSPWGQRLGQAKHNTDGTEELGVYGYNAHGNVDTLTGSGGGTNATYGYTVYGSDDDSEFTRIDKPVVTDPTKEPYIAYRSRANAGTWTRKPTTWDSATTGPTSTASRGGTEDPDAPRGVLDGREDVRNSPPQRIHPGASTGITCGQTLDLLNERTPPAIGGIAEEPPDLQLHHRAAPANGTLGELPPVTAVHPTRGSRAVPAPQLRYGAVGFGRNDPAHLGQPVQHHPHGVREQRVLQLAQNPMNRAFPP